jgi:hypothetical protein
MKERSKGWDQDDPEELSNCIQFSSATARSPEPTTTLDTRTAADAATNFRNGCFQTR